MPKFKVTVSETVEYIYEIEAENRTEADDFVAEIHNAHSGKMAREISVLDSETFAEPIDA